MRMRMTYAALAFCIAILFCAPPAAADKPGKGKKPPHAAVEHTTDETVETISDIVDIAHELLIGDKDREIIHSYLVKHPGNQEFCPPGLAKKNNGCLPPGIAKKYKIGKRLDDDVKIKSLPEKLLDLLTDPGKGRKYGMVDNDVVLMTEGTRIILDAVSAQ